MITKTKMRIQGGHRQEPVILEDLVYEGDVMIHGSVECDMCVIHGNLTVIGGNLRTTAHLFVMGDLKVTHGNLTVGWGMQVNGSVDINNTLTVNDQMTIKGNLISGDINIYGHHDNVIEGFVLSYGSVISTGGLFVKGDIRVREELCIVQGAELESSEGRILVGNKLSAKAITAKETIVITEPGIMQGGN